MTEFSVHDQPGFERVYDEDDEITIRKGDLRALLDLATQSMDFGSGFWDEEQVEIARKFAVILGIDPIIVTPDNFTFQYGCKARGAHKWEAVNWPRYNAVIRWSCNVCRHTSNSVTMPSGFDGKES